MTPELEMLRKLNLLPIEEPEIAPPGMKPPGYDYDTRAAEFQNQAMQLEQQAAAPVARPEGTKDNLINAARSFIEGMARPSDPFAEQRRREDVFRQGQNDLVARAKALRDDASYQSQLGETAQLRDVQRRREEREANQPYVNNIGQGIIARTPKGMEGNTLWEQAPGFSGPEEKPETPTEDMKEYAFINDPKLTPEERAGRIKFLNEQANRRNPSPNSGILAQLRGLDLENKTKATPGQVINAATGRPVDLNAAEATVLKDMKFLRDQTQYVSGLMKKAGDTGAIKGWVTVQGMTLPVLQDNLPVEFAELGAEIQRLNNAYVYAMSGKAINENEGVRLALTAPNIKYTPELNERMVQNFGRAATNTVNSFMEVNGWGFAPGERKPAMGAFGADPSQAPQAPQTPAGNSAPANKPPDAVFVRDKNGKLVRKK